MKHLIHILIISAILLGLAFCFGCKEKVEAAEPNEPTTYTVSSDGEIFIRITNLIPTWPDYIEVEKDLEIQWPDPNDGYYGFLIHIEKGTKIYFKE